MGLFDQKFEYMPIKTAIMPDAPGVKDASQEKGFVDEKRSF